jgi:signal transduction protein with GAF and PtsI domain
VSPVEEAVLPVQMERLEASLRRTQAELLALREISRAISSAWGLSQTLALITRKTAEVMGMDSCSVYLLEPARGQDGNQTEGVTPEGTLVLKASTGLAADAVGHAHLQVGEGITGWAAKEGRPLAISDAASDPRFKLLPETRELRFKSLLAVPLISREQTIGAVNVQTRAHHVYADDEVELLSTIADLTAGTIEKALLYEEIGGLREALETRKLVERAKGILMKRYSIDENEAFRRVHLQSRNTRRSMREIAQAIILTADI